MKTFLKNKAESRKMKGSTTGKQSSKNGYNSWKRTQPNAAKNFREAFRKARRIKAGTPKPPQGLEAPTEDLLTGEKF